MQAATRTCQGLYRPWPGDSTKTQEKHMTRETGSLRMRHEYAKSTADDTIHGLENLAAGCGTGNRLRRPGCLSDCDTVFPAPIATAAAPYLARGCSGCSVECPADLGQRAKCRASCNWRHGNPVEFCCCGIGPAVCVPRRLRRKLGIAHCPWHPGIFHCAASHKPYCDHIREWRADFS